MKNNKNLNDDVSPAVTLFDKTAGEQTAHGQRIIVQVAEL
jgi:hypothetical protein